MLTEIVLTLTGPDRVGIVEEVTGILLGLQANVGTSRMARLGGEFAILLDASLPAEQAARLDGAFADLEAQGYQVTVRTTSAPVRQGGQQVYRVEVSGADHEGIVYEIAAGLAERGISIDSAETSAVAAPVSGTPLFRMSAVVIVPKGLDEAEWLAALDEAAAAAGVDVEVTAAE